EEEACRAAGGRGKGESLRLGRTPPATRARSRFEVGFLALRRADYRALTAGSKCDYVQSLARLPPPARFPGCAVGNEAAGQPRRLRPFSGVFSTCSGYLTLA